MQSLESPFHLPISQGAVILLSNIVPVAEEQPELSEEVSGRKGKSFLDFQEERENNAPREGRAAAAFRIDPAYFNGKH